VESDKIQSKELAAALDEERNVPAETRLAAILSSTEVIAACERPTDLLDIAIAYLHRVHFVNFYEAYRYRDEGHMLLQSSRLYYRQAPYFVSETKALEAAPTIAPVLSASGTLGATASESAAVFDDEGRKRKREDDDDADKDKAEGEDAGSGPLVAVAVDSCNDETVAAEEVPPVARDSCNDETIGSSGEQETTPSTPAPPSGPAPPAGPPPATAPAAVISGIFAINPRITELIHSSKLIVQSRNKAAEGAPNARQGGFVLLEDEVNAINEKINAALMKEIDDLAQKDDGRVRCWFPNCSKLFKGPEFLCKHITSKHGIQELVLHVCEPAMRKRYDEDKLLDRPLPMISVETADGVEFKFAKEIIEAHTRKEQQPPRQSIGTGAGQFNRDRGSFGGGGRGGGGRGDFRDSRGDGGRGFRPRFSSSGGDDHRMSTGPAPPAPVIGRDSSGGSAAGAASTAPNTPAAPARPIRSYMDVDAPKVCVPTAVRCVIYVFARRGTP
jgi:hypothetical protein